MRSAHIRPPSIASVARPSVTIPRARSPRTSRSRRVRSPTAARSAATGRSSAWWSRGLVFIAAVLVWRIWPCAGSACVKNAEVGWVLASLAVPTALIAGFPLEGGSIRLPWPGSARWRSGSALGGLGGPPDGPLPGCRLAGVVARVPWLLLPVWGGTLAAARHHALPGALTRRSHPHQVTQRVELGRADARHVGQVVDRLERSVLRLGRRTMSRAVAGPTPGQIVELRPGGGVQVDRLDRRDDVRPAAVAGAAAAAPCRLPRRGGPRPGAAPAPAGRRPAGRPGLIASRSASAAGPPAARDEIRHPRAGRPGGRRRAGRPLRPPERRAAPARSSATTGCRPPQRRTPALWPARRVAPAQPGAAAGPPPATAAGGAATSPPATSTRASRRHGEAVRAGGGPHGSEAFEPASAGIPDGAGPAPAFPPWRSATGRQGPAGGSRSP